MDTRNWIDESATDLRIWYFCQAFLVLLVLVVGRGYLGLSRHQPRSLSNTGIPFIGNAYQYLTNNGRFLERVSTTLQRYQVNILKCSIGHVPLYLLQGREHIQTIFRDSATFSPNVFLLKVMGDLQGMAPSDVGKFASDHSGRLTKPTGPAAPDGTRYWALMHHAIEERFASKAAVAEFGKTFAHFFAQQLDRLPTNEWMEVCVFDFMRSAMCKAAVTSLVGRKVLEREPEFIEALWDYNNATCDLAMAVLPRWLDPGPWRKRDRFRQMAEDFLREDFESVDWTKMPDSAWDPVSGLRAFRSTQIWQSSVGMSLQTRAGSFIGFMHGLNGNSIPATAWIILELVKDPTLWDAVREEVSTCFTTDPDSEEQKVDATAILSLPLLQSIYVETLRLHASFNITREVTAETRIGQYRLPKNALVQAPTRFAHLDEVTWGVDGHPASEFWAARHLKFVHGTSKTGEAVTQPEFSVKGRPTDFFPYGAGPSMCPGRHMAKQLIMLSVAMLVNSFDVQFIEWRQEHGKGKSDRPAQDNVRFSGVALLPPDRDMLIRWRRKN